MSPSITRTLAFQPCITLSPITRSTRNEKYKGGRRITTNLNYPTLQHGEETAKTILKITQKLLSLGSEKRQGIYRQTRISGYTYGAARQILARGSIREPRALRCPHLSPCRLDVPVLGFGSMIFTESPPKSMAIFCRLLITH